MGDVRGIGPMQAMELVEDREKKTPAAGAAKELTVFCFDRGLILLSCGIYSNVIRFLMPLVTSEKELEQGLDIVEEGLSAISR